MISRDAESVDDGVGIALEWLMAVFIISYAPPPMVESVRKAEERPRDDIDGARDATGGDESGKFARAGNDHHHDDRAGDANDTDRYVDSTALAEIERAHEAKGEAERAATAVTDSARSAALGFLAGVRRGWGKRELAEWLVGSYTVATSFAPRGERVSRLEAQAMPLDEEILVDLMLAVRAQVAATLALLSSTHTRPWFVDQAIERGHIIASASHSFASEPEGELWLPRDRPAMRLGDRVLSLFACDYLARPRSFAHDLYICSCEAVSFDSEAKSRGACRSHDLASGITATRELLGADPSSFEMDDRTADTQRIPLITRKTARA